MDDQASAILTTPGFLHLTLYSWLTSRNQVFTNAASAWYDVVSAQPAPPQWTYTQLAATYPAASFTVDVDAMASGLKPYEPPPVEKRQDACPLAPSETDPGASSTAAEPATTLTNLPTLTTGIITPSGSSCVSTFTQTECAPGSGGTSVCVTTPACGSWTATVAPTTASADTPTPSDTSAALSLAIYSDDECTDLIDEFDIDVDTNCATHVKNNGDTQKFKCFIVKGADEGVSDQQLELTVYKDGHCTSDNDDDRKVYTDLDAIVDQDQTPFEMGSLVLKTGL